MKMTETAITIADMEHIHTIFGDFDCNINLIQKEYNVSVFSRGDEIKIVGEQNNVNSARKVLESLVTLLEKREEITEQSIRYVISWVNGVETKSGTRGDCVCVTYGQADKAKRSDRKSMSKQ